VVDGDPATGIVIIADTIDPIGLAEDDIIPDNAIIMVSSSFLRVYLHCLVVEEGVINQSESHIEVIGVHQVIIEPDEIAGYDIVIEINIGKYAILYGFKPDGQPDT